MIIKGGRAFGKWRLALSKLIEQWKLGKETMMISSGFVSFLEHNK